ncbi:MAG TPA: hypothetical protein VLH38_03085 [Patescibacteria group bacterium]|nr:hypothetical protein [Patescibacteria group bacterium]
MNDKQKEQSHYQLAFLASIVGLAAFRGDLSSISFALFGLETTLFRALIPTVVLLFIGAYINAITLTVVDGLNITRFPLRGLLLRLSMFCNLLGLLFPLGVLLMWLVAKALGLADKTGATTSVLTIAMTMTVIQLAIIYKISRKLQQQNAQAIALRQMRESELRQTEQNETKDAAASFLQQYAYLIESLKKYLGLKGYGTRTSDLVFLANVLQQKKLFTAADVKSAKTIASFRDNLVHNAHVFTTTEHKDLELQLEGLYQKLRVDYLKLIETSSDIHRSKMAWRTSLLSIMSIVVVAAALLNAMHLRTINGPWVGSSVGNSQESPNEKLLRAMNDLRKSSGTGFLRFDPIMLTYVSDQCTGGLSQSALDLLDTSGIDRISFTTKSEKPQDVLAAIESDPTIKAKLLNPAYTRTAFGFCNSKSSAPQQIGVTYIQHLR